MTTERNVCLDKLRHAGLDLSEVAMTDLSTVSFIDGAEIALGYRSAQNHAAARKDILCSLAKKEAERITVHASSKI